MSKLWDWLSSWIATIEILCDRKLCSEIREAKEEFERGESIPWDPYDANTPA